MRNKSLATSPFDSSRYIGSVIFVNPDTAKINLPYAASVSSKQYAGYPVNGGQVGEFVFIESDEHAVLGRIIEVRLPDTERLNAEPAMGKQPDAHPIGVVQLLTTLELSTGNVISGIPQHPRIGQHVYSAHPLLVKHVVEGNTSISGAVIELATTTQSSSTKVNITPEQLIGRHCAVLGSTGGGKSWTVARISQEIARIGGKVILIDPTDEFHTFVDNVSHIYLGGQKQNEQDSNVYVSFPYWELTELDLFALFQPSHGVQAPKLREALASLKLLNVVQSNSFIQDGKFIKKGNNRTEFTKLLATHTLSINSSGAKYDIRNLPDQIYEECISDKWDKYEPFIIGNCEPLNSRIRSIINSPSLTCLFSPKTNDFKNLTKIIDEFFKSTNKILRISMQHLSFEHNARELLVNALGRYLLLMARKNMFKESPLVVVLDEAHQFLNKNLGDETNRVVLDAFGLIAKEGRKYGLTTILATQRPRDIPEDVLSQVGMFVVHRLINERDRQVVEKACGNLDGSAAAFLPTLGQGEAILVGVNFPMPTPVKIIEPEYRPKSNGPDYSKYWCDLV